MTTDRPTPGPDDDTPPAYTPEELWPHGQPMILPPTPLPPGATPDPTCILEHLGRSLTEAQRAKRVAAAAHFYVVDVPDDGKPSVHEFQAVREVAGHLREVARRGGWAFVFQGRRWPTSAGPFRYLIDPDGGPPVPLFTAPEPVPDESGAMDDGPPGLSAG